MFIMHDVQQTTYVGSTHYIGLQTWQIKYLLNKYTSIHLNIQTYSFTYRHVPTAVPTSIETRLYFFVSAAPIIIIISIIIFVAISLHNIYCLLYQTISGGILKATHGFVPDNLTVPPVPVPLTPGTNQKTLMSQAIMDTFQSFKNEQVRLSIPRGQLSNGSEKYYRHQLSHYSFLLSNILIHMKNCL